MFSLVLRRIHMYLALFLAPWMLIYALSTLAMNHRASVRQWYGGTGPAFTLERELTYEAAFPAGAKPPQMARQILSGIDVDAPHNAGRPGADGRFAINVFDPRAPRRVTYIPAQRKLVIERQVFRWPAFLERMHRRRGFQPGYTRENVWAFSVDLVIVAMLFWALSGLWLWWGMRLTRAWGAAFLGGGAALFALFLACI